MTNQMQIVYSLMLALSLISGATTAILFDELGESGVFLPARKIFPDSVSVPIG